MLPFYSAIFSPFCCAKLNFTNYSDKSRQMKRTLYPEPPPSQIEVNGVTRNITWERGGIGTIYLPVTTNNRLEYHSIQYDSNCNNCGAPRTSSLCAYCGTGKQKPFVTKPSIEIQMAFDRAVRQNTNAGLLHDHWSMISAGIALLIAGIIIFCS